MAEVEKRTRGRPPKNPDAPKKPFNFKEYYQINGDKFRVEGNIKYYRKVTDTPKAELEAYAKLGMTPETILKKLKEKVLIKKIQKLHEIV
jgi:predicted AAA+ superfamily ATPase